MNIIQKNVRTLSLDKQGQVASAVLSYVAGMEQGEKSDDEKMLRQVFEQAPESIGSAVRSGIELLDCRTPDVYELGVSYTTVAAEEPSNNRRAAARHGDKFWSSKCTLAKEKCYETPEKQKVFASPGAAYCAVGYSTNWNGKFGEDSSIGGIDKLVPRCEEFCRKYIFASQCDASFRQKAIELVGKINNSSFRSWASYEVMLSSLEISEPFCNDLNQTLVELQCSFSVRRHRRKVEWCGIEVGRVRGWDHLWGTFYADPANRDIKSGCAFVGRLYDSGDFGILGLEN